MRGLADLATEHPWRLLGGYAALVVVAGLSAAGAGARITNSGFQAANSDSARARTIMARDLGAGRTDAALFLQAPDASSLRVALARLATVPRRQLGAADIGNPHVGAGGTVALVPVGLSAGIGAAQKLVPRIEAAIHGAVGRLHVQATVLGFPAAARAYADAARTAATRSERYAVPFALGVLLVAFGSVVAAGIPVLLAIGALVLSLGAIGVVARLTEVNVAALNVAILLALALCIDFALLIVSRFREQLGAGLTPPIALRETMATAGRTILISAVTVAISLAGLFVMGLGIFSSVAFAAIAATGAAALTASTVLPPVLVLLGPRLERLAIRRPASTAVSISRWSALGRFVLGHRVECVVASLLILAALVAPATNIGISVRSASLLSSTSDLARASRAAAAAFGPGAATPVDVVTAAPSTAIVGYLPRRSEIIDTSSLRGMTLMRVALDRQFDSPAAESTVRSLRGRLAAAGVPGTYVGGITAENVDLEDRIASRLPLAVTLTLVAAYVLLAAALRSVVVPAKAVATTAVTVAASLGVVALIFGSHDLGYFVPVFLFALIFGLSVDYEVFLISRIRHEHLNGASSDESIVRGLAQTGRIITLAAMVMVAVFLGTALSGLKTLEQLGTGLAIAVALDATLVRCVFVPAALALLGERNWWFPLDTGRRRLRVDAQGPSR